MKTMLVVVVLLSASAAQASRPTAFETASLAAAETSLVLDALQTFDIKNHAAFNEQNPILGSSPRGGAVIGYFAGTVLLTAAAWYVLPSRWRLLVPAVVLALEVPQVARNESRIDFDARYCARCNPRAAVRRGLSLRVRF